MLNNYFNESVLKEIFYKKIYYRGSMGIDGMSPTHYGKDIDRNVEYIIKKIKSQDYKFIPYKEKLVLKSRNKTPRMMSIPCVRDKLVVGTLTKMIQGVFGDRVSRKLPNNFIADIKRIIKSNEGNLFFIKADIKNFFPTIEHDKLLNLLKKRELCPYTLHLIQELLKNPTVPENCKRINREKYVNNTGTPQGLSISSILSDIYLTDIDSFFKSQSQEISYFRYVDDILLLVRNENDITRLKKSLESEFEKIGLSLNPDKNDYGQIQKGFTFLGYKISHPTITVKDKNVNNFIKKIAQNFNWFKKIYQKPFLLGVGDIKDKNKIKTRFINELNDRITGVIIDNRKYGWVFYFNEVDDIKLLFVLDNIVDSFFKKLDEFDNKTPKEVKRFVRAYYESKRRLSGNYIRNFNKYTTIQDKIKYLKDNVILDSTRQYKKEEIEYLFEKTKFNRMSKLKLDVGKKS